MNIKNIMAAFLCVLFLVISLPSNACTRALYVGEDDLVITGRSMDWAQDMGSNLWVFPRGISRNGEAGPDSPQWVSKYGSVIASVYGIASADGMNEKGLVMNMLYLVESDYGSPTPGHKPLSITLWGQYALDNFATVAEAVESMQAQPFYIMAPKLPDGNASQLHLSLSDATGDSAIFEYIDGKLVVHHSKQYQVMTNSPTYAKQLALNAYWKNIGGLDFLPGTNRAADRFARTSFLINAIPKEKDVNFIQSVAGHSYKNQAIASVLSVMRAVSVPLGITTPGQPNIASTLWRTVADQKHLVYYFDSSTRPNVLWVDLAKLDFKEEAPILKLALENGDAPSGEASAAFKPAQPFKFLSAIKQPS